MSRDIVTDMTILAITRANVREITASSEPVAHTYGGVAGVPADGLRIPISVYAVAKDLGLPYENIRRRVKKLLDAGVCITVDGGVQDAKKDNNVAKIEVKLTTTGTGRS